MNEVLVIRSCVSPQALKITLFRGFAIAFLGMALILAAGIYFPVELLNRWGWILFLISLGLMTFGLLPYRRLAKLQLNPDKLTLIDQHHIAYTHEGRQLLTIALTSIEKMSYKSHPRLYGITMTVDDPIAQSIRIHEPHKRLNLFRGKEKGKNDFFFPYFNQKAYEELLEWKDAQKGDVSLI